MDEKTEAQLARQYQTSIEDIRLFKQTIWKITTTCYALFGAMILKNEKLSNCYVNLILILLIVVFGILSVCLTNRSLNKSRCVIKRIRQTYTKEAEEIIGNENINDTQPSKKECLPEKLFFEWIFYAAIAIAALMTCLILTQTIW